MKNSRTFANQPDSVRASRQFVAQLLGDAPTNVSDAVILMTSELTTNCIRHAGSAFTLTIEVTAEQVRVEVTDSGTGTPSIRSPEPTETSGRGLQIVATLSDDWGVTPATGARSKTVWFTHTPLVPKRDNTVSRHGV